MEKKAGLLQDKTVAIIGGGPGGLTLARILQMRSVNVTVFERDASPATRVQGTCLDLHESTGRRALRDAGLLEQYFLRARSEGDRHLIMDKHKKIKLNLPPMRFVTPDPEIDRGDLRQLLLDSLKPATILWDHHFKSLSRSNDGRWRVDFADKPSATFDLIVGSDGARSKVRPYVTDLKPKYSGVAWIETEIANSHPDFQEFRRLIDQGSLFAFGDQKALLLQEKSDGHTMTYFTEKVSESEFSRIAAELANPRSADEYLRNYLGGWNPDYQKLIRASTGKYIMRPIYASDPEQFWPTKDGLALIGDAAHVMPPFAGQGANMAMLDAVVLADALTGIDHADLTAAIRSYETEMFRRTSLAMQQTQENEEIFYVDEAADLLIGKMLGAFKFLSPLIPHIVNLLNKFSDLRGRTPKRASIP